MNEHATTSTLASTVSERRIELGLTKSELCRRAHITRSTLHEIENGTRRALMPATYEALDEALEWLPGTLRRITSPMNGSVPVVKLHVPHLHEQILALRTAIDEREALDRMYQMLLDVTTALDAECQELRERVAELESRLPIGA